ncbi:MAG: hypothetical protein FJ112_09450 [Deltaproteobacteria bacterium]|nr:hypothetical protein [Deltaproteobacteria bacterium]
MTLLKVKRIPEAEIEIDKFALAAIRQGRVTQYIDLIEVKAQEKPNLRKKFYEKILSIERTRPDIFLGLAQVLRQMGKITQAYEIIFAALKIDRRGEQALKLLKEMIAEQGSESAQVAYDNLIIEKWSLEKVRAELIGNSEIHSSNSLEISEHSIGTNNRSVLSPLSEESIGSLKSLIQELEEQLGERPPGIETLSGLVTEFKEKALQLVKGDSKSVLDLAIAFKEMGLAVQAKEAISGIESSNNKYLAAQCLLGEIEFEQESYFSSLDIFQKVLRSESNDDECKKDALYHVVRIYIELQDFKKAAEFADKLSEMDSAYRNLPSLRNEISTRLESLSKFKLR